MCVAFKLSNLQLCICVPPFSFEFEPRTFKDISNLVLSSQCEKSQHILSDLSSTRPCGPRAIHSELPNPLPELLNRNLDCFFFLLFAHSSILIRCPHSAPCRSVLHCPPLLCVWVARCSVEPPRFRGARLKVRIQHLNQSRIHWSSKVDDVRIAHVL